MLKHPFGSWLADAMTARSLLLESLGKPALTPLALAAELSIAGHPTSREAVGTWLRGVARPRDDVRRALAHILGKSTAEVAVACAGEQLGGLPLPQGPSAPSPGAGPVSTTPLPIRSGGLGSEGGGS